MGVDVVVRRHPPIRGYAAIWDRDKGKVRLYSCNIADEQSLDMTLAHEFVHVIEDLLISGPIRDRGHGCGQHGKYYEPLAERIVRHRPRVIRFIKALYNIDYRRLNNGGPARI